MALKEEHFKEEKFPWGYVVAALLIAIVAGYGMMRWGVYEQAKVAAAQIKNLQGTVLACNTELGKQQALVKTRDGEIVDLTQKKDKAESQSYVAGLNQEIDAKTISSLRSQLAAAKAAKPTVLASSSAAPPISFTTDGNIDSCLNIEQVLRNRLAGERGQ